MTDTAHTAEPLRKSSATEVVPGADASPAPSESVRPVDENQAKVTILEMRQVAGLTAGSVMGLHRGSFQFRESDKEVGFSLNVQGTDDVMVIAGSSTTVVDEIPVTEPTPLGHAVLNVGSACFTVRPMRPEPSNGLRLEALIEARTPPKALAVPEFLEGEPLLEQAGSVRFGSLFSKPDDEPVQSLDAQSWLFLESIRDMRSMVAERHRRLHPDPEELLSRLARLDPGLWDRTTEHPLFARFPIAYSTIPWEPRFDDPDRIPADLHRPIREMSCLPWVPITANLLNGPLGIVGSRPAVLACARNAVLTLACLTAPRDIEFSIVTAQGLVEDWDWTSSLPNSLFPSDDQNYCVAVADGMIHFDGAGLDPQAVKENEIGLIVLEESAADLPDYCGTILELTADGQCQVTNHLGEQILGTPIGVAAGFAATAASIIREAIGDEPADDDLLGELLAAPITDPPRSGRGSGRGSAPDRKPTAHDTARLAGGEAPGPSGQAEPIIDEPIIDGQITDDPITDDPIIDGQITDQITDDPITDPITDEQITDDPIIDDQITDDEGRAGQPVRTDDLFDDEVAVAPRDQPGADPGGPGAISETGAAAHASADGPPGEQADGGADEPAGPPPKPPKKRRRKRRKR